jgi:hypothetical protein
MFFLQKQHRNYKKDLARIDEIIEFCTKANEKLNESGVIDYAISKCDLIEKELGLSFYRCTPG